MVALHVVPAAHGRRVGISVSKKVGNAVIRNRVRRRLREVVRSRIAGWKGGLDAVLVARSASAEASFEDLTVAVAEVTRRARLDREPEAPPDTPFSMPAGGRPPRESGRDRTPRDGGPQSGR